MYGDESCAADGQGDELSMKYKRVSTEDAEQGWNEVYEASMDSCMHGMYCQQGADCQVRAHSQAPESTPLRPCAFPNSHIRLLLHACRRQHLHCIIV